MAKFLGWMFAFLTLLAGTAHAGLTMPQGSSSKTQNAAPSSSSTAKLVAPPLHEGGTPELGSCYGVQTKIVGSDKAGVITISDPGEDSWNLGCQISFDDSFKTPVCTVSVSNAAPGMGVRIVALTPQSLHVQAYPNNFRGGENVMYLCAEATP